MQSTTHITLRFPSELVASAVVAQARRDPGHARRLATILANCSSPRGERPGRRARKPQGSPR